MRTAKATLVNVKIEGKGVDAGSPLSTTVGVVEGGWQDWMLETELDGKVFFWFDELADIEVGTDTGDDVIVEIESEPYEVELEEVDAAIG